MATRPVPLVPLSDDGQGTDPRVDAALQRPWRKARALSSGAARAEIFLERAAFDRAPWLTVALVAGIACWFVLPGPVAWLAWIGAALLAVIAAAAIWHDGGDRTHLRRAVIAVGLLLAFGLSLVWVRSEVVGAQPLSHPQAQWIDGRVLAREDQPAEGRVRLTLF